MWEVGKGCKQLKVIGPPAGMTTIPYLKDIIGQAKVFIRPKEDTITDVL